MSESPDNRLDRIEKNLETSNGKINKLQRMGVSLLITLQKNHINIDYNAKENAHLQASVDSLVKIVEAHQTKFDMAIFEIKKKRDVRKIHVETEELPTEGLNIQQGCLEEEDDR